MTPKINMSYIDLPNLSFFDKVLFRVILTGGTETGVFVGQSPC